MHKRTFGKIRGGLVMGFTTRCIIHENTTKIRNSLKKLGYHCNPYLGWNNLYTSIHGYASGYSISDDNINFLFKEAIDCGTNEELFLAIAALRDDTNYMQWFICIEDYRESRIKEWKVGDFDLNTCPDEFSNELPHLPRAGN